jgi:hypothetical protein
MITGFVGREDELSWLAGHLRNGKNLLALNGRAASGKSVLLYEFEKKHPEWTFKWVGEELFRDFDGNISAVIRELRNDVGGQQSHVVIIDEAHSAPVFHELREYVRTILAIPSVVGVVLASQFSLAERLPGLTELELTSWSVDAGKEPNFYFAPSSTGTSAAIEIIGPKIVLANEELIRNLRRFPEDLRRLPPRKFEELVAELLKDQGAEVQLTQATRDGGRDVIASFKSPFGRLLTLVEAKRYRADRPVRLSVVRELYGAYHHYRKTDEATHAMLVTTSFFTPDAREFQSRHEYELDLKEFDDVKDWITKYRRAG